MMTTLAITQNSNHSNHSNHSMDKFNSALSDFKDELFQSFMETAELASAAQTLPPIENKNELMRINSEINPGDIGDDVDDYLDYMTSIDNIVPTVSVPAKMRTPLMSMQEIEAAAQTAEVATDLIAKTLGAQYESLLNQLADLQNDFYSCLQELSQAAENEVAEKKGKDGQPGLIGAKATLMALADLEKSCKSGEISNSIGNNSATKPNNVTNWTKPTKPTKSTKPNNANKALNGFTLFMKSFYAQPENKTRKNPGACGIAWKNLSEAEKNAFHALAKANSPH
jgi:hypothetical protein